MTQFPWKITRNGVEIYFPEGSRRFVSVSVEQISGDGRLDRAIDASAIFLGDAAFRLHAVTLSCQGHTVAPVFDLWPSQQVTLECPVEFAVPGPSAVLAYDPVAGSVYGVDEDDNRLAATVVGRNVTSAGAVAIRFRPVMQCVVASRNADKTQNRADAGWTIRLEETGGDETGFGEDADTVVFASPGLQGYSVGTAFSLSLAASVTSSTGLPVVFSVLSGSLPDGLTMNSAGVISGTPTEYGLSVVVVRAQSARSGRRLFHSEKAWRRARGPGRRSRTGCRRHAGPDPDLRPADLLPAGHYTQLRAGLRLRHLRPQAQNLDAVGADGTAPV